MHSRSHAHLHTFGRRHARVAAFFVLGVSVAFVSYGAWQLTAGERERSAWPDAGHYEPLLNATREPLAESEPTSINIPAIRLSAEFEEPLGVASDGTVEVPDTFTDVGWYKYGPTPGELGPAVVIGHVDSYEGPAVFYDLRKLKENDRIMVTREDGSVAVFAVTHLQHVSQDTFPTADVYGDIDHAGLRLITCTGTYDRGERRYSHNLIVYARLVEGRVQS